MSRYLDSAVSVMDRLLSPVCKNMSAISSAVVGLMCLPVVLDVICRFFISKSIPGVIDIEELSMVVVVFLALGFLQLEKEHICIDLLVSHFPEWLQTVVDSFNYLVSTVLFGLMTWQAAELAIKKIGTKTIGLGIPLSIFIFVAALGTLLITLVLLTDFLRTASLVIKKGRWPWLGPVVTLGALLMLSPLLIKAADMSLSGLALGCSGMLLLFSLMLLRMPIGFAMALVGFLGMVVTNPNINAALSTLGMAPYHSTASFIIAVAPLFILMGELALYSGISQDLFDTANKWLGRMPGGLAMSAVAGCAGFAAVCGDSMATAVTMSTVSLPEMRKKKYNPGLATGCLAAGGTLGILIPPSMGFIFYAIVTEESIGKLFMAGILPGLLLTTLYIISIYIIAKRNPAMAPRGEQFNWKEKFISLKGVIGMLFLFILILGGILGGIFSPTEGGAIGAFGAFMLGIIRRRLDWKNLKVSLEETSKITTKLLMILIGVGVLGYFLAATRLPFALADMVTGLPFGRYTIFAAVCVLYIILGCLMNVIPMILLTLPAIYPSIFALGFDPVWFGVVVVILMEMGQITPPVGVNVFALSSIAKDVPMQTIFRGIVPFFLCMVVCIALLVLFPQIALYLPNLLF